MYVRAGVAMAAFSSFQWDEPVVYIYIATVSVAFSCCRALREAIEDCVFHELFAIENVQTE
eukprot:IDg9570t1